MKKFICVWFSSLVTTLLFGCRVSLHLFDARIPKGYLRLKAVQKCTAWNYLRYYLILRFLLLFALRFVLRFWKCNGGKIYFVRISHVGQRKFSQRNFEPPNKIDMSSFGLGKFPLSSVLEFILLMCLFDTEEFELKVLLAL